VLGLAVNDQLFRFLFINSHLWTRINKSSAQTVA